MMEARTTAKRPTAHEQFAGMFDVYPTVSREAMNRQQGSAALQGTRAFSSADGAGGAGGSAGELAHPQAVFGFGDAAVRFNNVDMGADIGMVNKRVLRMDPRMPYSVDALPPGAPSNTLPAYAARFRQLDGAPHGHTPAFGAPDGPAHEGKAYVLPKAHFINGRLTQPDVVEAAVPRGAAMPGRVHEPVEGVITPAERREALAFEKAHLRARAEHRAQKSAACRTVHLMRRAHPNGLIGVEAPGMDGSAVYAEETAALRAQQQRAAAFAAARAEHLHGRANSAVGHPLLEFDPGSEEQVKLFQSRARSQFSSDAWAGRGDNFVVQPAVKLHHLRQPGNNQEKVLRPPDSARAQRIYDAREGGRSWDIITGVEKPWACSAGAAEKHDRWRAHESHVAAAQAAAVRWPGGLGRFGPSTTS